MYFKVAVVKNVKFEKNRQKEMELRIVNSSLLIDPIHCIGSTTITIRGMERMMKDNGVKFTDRT